MYKAINFLLLFLLSAYSAFAGASDREVVAKIYNRNIYRDEVQGGRTLHSLLIPPLYKRFAADNNINATETEIQEVMSAISSSANSLTSPEQRTIMHDMAKATVLDWKVSKALYKKYGGDVIFQQANPMEPIGAEHLFLEEQEKAGAFQILDAKEREKFFSYYVQPQKWVIPPSKVNYDQPWWRQ